MAKSQPAQEQARPSRGRGYAYAGRQRHQRGNRLGCGRPSTQWPEGPLRGRRKICYVYDTSQQESLVHEEALSLFCHSMHPCMHRNQVKACFPSYTCRGQCSFTFAVAADISTLSPQVITISALVALQLCMDSCHPHASCAHKSPVMHTIIDLQERRCLRIHRCAAAPMRKHIISDVRPGYVRPSTPLKYLVQHLQIGKLYKCSIMNALAHWGKLCP